MEKEKKGSDMKLYDDPKVKRSHERLVRELKKRDLWQKDDKVWLTR